MPEPETIEAELEFYATKIYLSKIAEKYKLRGYNDVFLDDNGDYLEEIKGIIKSINIQNSYLKELIQNMNKGITEVGKAEKLDSKIRKTLMENRLHIYNQFINYTANIIKSEENIINIIDKFRRIEQEIDIKNRALTRYGFDKELKNIVEGITNGKYYKLSIIIFDMNNLKSINENYGHQTGAEAIHKFGTILKETLNDSGVKYLLSNYFGGDEWFLCLIDIDFNKSISFVKKFFNILNKNKYKIRDYELKLGSCAGIAYYQPESDSQEFLTPKQLITIADTLVLQSKIRKTKNKTGNAYKIINITDLSRVQLNQITKKIQTIPRALNKNTLNKKKLIDLFKIRKKQNELIMLARTLGVKKVLRYNIDLINEIIGNKIIESISNVLIDTKKQTYKKVEKINKKLSNMIIGELEKISNNITLNQEQKTEFINKLISSSEFQKFNTNEIESIYENNGLEI